MPDHTTPPPPPVGPDHHARPDDDLVAAYVDGEASAGERARVESDPALRARADDFRAVASAVGTPGAPVDEVERDRAVSAALDATEPDVPVTPIGRARRPTQPPRGWLVAAVVVLLALGVGVLATVDLGDGGGGADTAAGPAAEDDAAEATAEGAGALPVGPSGAAVDLGEVADVDEVRERLAAATGLGAEAPDAFGQGGDQPDAPVEEGGEAESAEPGDGARLSERCEVAVVESNPQLLGQLVQATATYQGTDALVFAYSARSGPQVVVIIVATDDCRNLDRFVIDG